MIERVIENWLSNSDERGFQIPLGQLLSLQRYKIVHASTHGPFEQGKDIIAIDPTGIPCAIQLKAGDISLDRWRKIWPEIDELIEIPINHPSIDKTIRHRAILITSGDFSDPVRREIDDRNEDRKRKNQTILETIVKGQLLQDFIAVNEQFYPKEILDIQLFLNLYTYDGKCPLPKERISKFLSLISPLDEKINKKDIVRLAASNLLFSKYIYSSYEKAKNYWSLADGWIVSTAYLLAMAEKYDAYEELKASIELSLLELESALFNLEKETLENPDLLQGGDLFDGMIIPFRTTILAGYLAAYRLFLLIKGAREWWDDKLNEFFVKHLSDLKIYSEGETPLFLNIFWCFDKNGKKEEAKKLLATIVNSIIYISRKQKEGLISPYYEAETVIRYHMGLLEEPINETFVDSSYSTSSLINLIVRREMKSYLAKIWRPITYIRSYEFIPKDLWETFLYRAEHGNLESRLLNKTQSWTALVEEANRIDIKQMPVGLIKYPQFLILLWLVFPHRMRPSHVKYLDEAILKA